MLTLIASPKGGGGGSLWDDFWVMFVTDGEGSENITRVDIHDVSRFLPLTPERGYDVDTDTLTLGIKPEASYRVITNGDFVSYRQWIDDERAWDVVAISLRQASKHLAPAIAASSAAQQEGPLDEGGRLSG